jgi:hypothetical protein
MLDKSNYNYLYARWAARLTSLFFIGVYVLMIIGEGFEPAQIKPFEWVMLLFGPLGLIFGMILGWWKEGLGGAIIILSLLLALMTGDYSGSGAGYMMICATPGFLYLLAWLLARNAKKTQSGQKPAQQHGEVCRREAN